MPVPLWVPGQLIGAGDVNAWMVPLTAYKLSATTRSSTTTQTADPDLAVNFPQGGSWVIEAVVRFHAVTGVNMSWGWQTSATSIAGSVAALFNNSSGAVELSYRAWTYTASLAQTPTGSTWSIRFSGLVTVGSGGTFAFAWAQGTSNATALSVDPGSYLMAWRSN